jgi:hypothetical protein
MCLKSTNQKQELHVVAIFVNGSRRNEHLNRGPSIDASYQVSVHLAKRFHSVTVDGRNLIFGHKLHIGTPYHEKRFLTHRIPTSCLHQIPVINSC